jgi:hypothetical protein
LQKRKVFKGTARRSNSTTSRGTSTSQGQGSRRREWGNLWQNKPEPSPDRHDVYDGKGHRGYVTLSFVMPTDRDGTVRGRERFRIPGMARMGNTCPSMAVTVTASSAWQAIPAVLPRDNAQVKGTFKQKRKQFAYVLTYESYVDFTKKTIYVCQ